MEEAHVIDTAMINDMWQLLVSTYGNFNEAERKLRELIPSRNRAFSRFVELAFLYHNFIQLSEEEKVRALKSNNPP